MTMIPPSIRLITFILPLTVCYAMFPASAAIAHAQSRPPVLSLAGSDSGAVAVPGQLLAYTLDYANDGAGQAMGVTINEVVPANSSFNATASSPSVWNCLDVSAARTTCSLTLGTLEAASRGSSRFAVRVEASAAGATAIADTANISDDSLHGRYWTPYNKVVTISTPVRAPHLSVSQQSSMSSAIRVVNDQLVTYTVSVTNNGQYTATNVLLTDLIPVGTIFQPASASLAPNSNSNSKLIWAQSSLGTGESFGVVFTVRVTDSANGQILYNVANATYN